MIKKIVLILGSLIFTLFLGVLLLLFGMNIGGNYFTDFEIFGMRGYEATGNIGFFVGILVGVIISVIVLSKIFRQKEKE